MSIYSLYVAILTVLFFAKPQFVFAQVPPTNFSELVDIFLDIIGYLVPLIFLLIFLFLVWGVIKTWILKPGDSEQVESGKRIVLVGVIVLVLVIGIWGVLNILRRTFFGI